MFKFCSVILFIGLSVNGAELPSDIEQCEYHDNDCFKSSFNQVVQKYYKTGYPEIGLSTLDPLRLEDIISERDDTKPVSIALKATDIKFFGLNKMTISKITRGFTKDFDGKLIDITFKFPIINITSNYVLDAKILVIPISGKGKSYCEMYKNYLNIKFTPRIETRNGEEYIRVEKLKVNYTTKKIVINLSNLYNGNKALGDATNKFLNDNWEVIYNEVNPGLFLRMQKRVTEIFQQVFDKIPHKKLFKQ